MITKVKKVNIVFLSLLSFRGISPGATHYYGRLEHLQGGERFDVTFKMTKEQAIEFNGRKNLGYRMGEISDRFSTTEKAIRAAKRQFRKHWPKATVLVLGSASTVEPQQILIGPKEFKNKINILAARYDELDWDFKPDRKEIEELEKQWQKLWPIKYR